MRLSTSQIYDKGLSSVIDRQNKLVKVQDQIARETKILTPADDPAGKAQTLALTDRIKQNEQFQKNSELVVNDLSRQDSFLSNINASLFRAKELFVQSGNGALSADDRQALALEIEVLRDNALDAMNSQSENGDYLFSGYQTEERPFNFDPELGIYTYSGDQGAKRVQLTSSLSVQSSTPGSEAFDKTPMQLKARVGNSTGDIVGGSSLVTDRATFNAYHAANYDKTVTENNQFRVEFNAAGDEYQIFRNNEGGADILVDTQPYVEGDPVEFNGMQLTVNGDTAGGSLEFRLSRPTGNVATVLNDMLNILNDPSVSSADLSQAIEFGIADLDASLNSLGSARAKIGSRLNSAETARLTNADLSIANQDTRSRIQDVDYAEAMTELVKQDTALQAAQATFTRITRLSLFDYLR